MINKNDKTYRIVNGIKHCLWCGTCHSKEDLIPYSKDHKRSVWWYKCNACNTKRLKNYFKTKNGKLNITKNIKKWVENNQEKRKAWNIVSIEKRAGRLAVPYQCSLCDCVCKVQAHHVDYSKPLEITWVCVKCHANIHRQIENKNV